jgi:hypothetical protein
MKLSSAISHISDSKPRTDAPVPVQHFDIHQ